MAPRRVQLSAAAAAGDLGKARALLDAHTTPPLAKGTLPAVRVCIWHTCCLVGSSFMIEFTEFICCGASKSGLFFCVLHAIFYFVMALASIEDACLRCFVIL